VALASVGSIAKSLRGTSGYAFRLVSRDHVLSLVDQAIVSATGFLTTVLIARWSDPAQLGIYALGLSLLLSLLGFQDSLILQPYLIQRHHPQGTPSERAGASLALSFLFTAASVLILAVAALGFFGFGGSSQMTVVTLVIAAIAPFALTRDFARRFAFAHLEMGRVLVLDASAAIIQLAALVWLGAGGRMSALSAFAAFGAACALPTAAWLYYARAEFAIRPQSVHEALKRTWALGKWLLAGRVTTQIQGYIIYWIAAAIGGAAVTGVYAACMSIVGFANPLIIGLSNVFMPKAVLAWKRGGASELWRETIRNTALMAAVMSAFSLAVLFGGEPAMRLLFHGRDFQGYGHTLIVLALAISLGTLGAAASIALATMERPRVVIVVTTLEALVTTTLVWILMTQWGLLGAAYGMLAGTLTGVIGRWIAFYLRAPHQR